jgi:hypothetical protein
LNYFVFKIFHRGVENIKQKDSIKEKEAKLKIQKIFENLEQIVLEDKETLKKSFLENIDRDDIFMKQELENNFEFYFENKKTFQKKQQNLKIIKI